MGTFGLGITLGIAAGFVACTRDTDSNDAPRSTAETGATDSDTAVEPDSDTGSTDDSDAGSGTDPIEGEPPPAPFLSSGVLTKLTDEIDAILDGTTRGVRVIDAENGQVIYEYDADLPLKPASNTKLFTTATAMDALGEETRFQTTVFAPAAPTAEGAVASTTVLVEHDSTWSSLFYADEAFPAERLADTLWDAGIRSIAGTLTLSGEVLVDGYSLGTYDAEDHREAGLLVLEEALWDRGITVDSTAVSAGLDPPSGVVLAERNSPPLSVVCHPINVYSHNEMADILARHNGWVLFGQSTYADGEEAMLQLLSDLGINAGGVNFEDGSGLSHDNRVTARVVTELLTAMFDRPAGLAWERTFSIAGVIGTLASRMTGSDTFGRVVGKTGSLWDTIALSGVLYNRYDGHRYVFSILQNDVDDQDDARALADEVVTVLAGDLRGHGAQVEAPVLLAVTNAGDETLTVTWAPASGAVAYAVWVSSDGLVWDREAAVVTMDTSSELVGRPVGSPTYVRVAALDQVSQSEPSDVYASTPGYERSRVLVVDGNDRWDVQWENSRGAGHDFVRAIVEAMQGESVDSAANDAVITGAVSLLDYDAVIWLLGEESTEHASFDAEERELVGEYLDAGGRLLVSGAEVAWDLDAEGTDDTRAFYGARLHASYQGDDAGTFTVWASEGGLFAGLGELSFYTPARLVVDYPDLLNPEDGAESVLTYVGGTGGTAAVAYAGTYRVLTFGFPIESIDGKDARSRILERALGFFEI